MFELITLVVSPLQTNCYLLIDKKTRKALIIDPGDDAEYIERVVNDHKCHLTMAIATHGHFDHLMAATELQLAYKIPFFIHKKDQFLLISMRDSARHFLDIEAGPAPTIGGYLKDKEKIKFGNSILEVRETPGHTPGSICFYLRQEKKLFCGDLFFAGGGVGRTDFSYSNFAKLRESLKKVFQLPSQTKIFPGHGISSTIKEEIINHKDLLSG